MYGQQGIIKSTGGGTMTEDAIKALIDDDYVNVPGDTMTGALTITPAGSTALTANKDVVIKAGKKLILDGG